ncbi:hypothetical protein ABT189_16770 [Streptomyces sp900105755]
MSQQYLAPVAAICAVAMTFIDQAIVSIYGASLGLAVPPAQGNAE